MSKSVIALAVAALVVVAGLAIYFGPKIFGPDTPPGPAPVANACETRFIAQTGIKKFNFGGFKAGGEGVEVKGLELVNDPEVKPLLSEKQNQLALGEYFFCEALARKEFAADDGAIANWYRDKFQFLATGPTAEQMQSWETGHPRPEGYHLVVSDLTPNGDNAYQLANWRGLNAGFGVTNDGTKAAPVTLQDFPRQTYLLLANGAAQGDNILQVPPQKGVRFELYLLDLDAPAGEAHFRLHLAQSQVFDVAIQPPTQLATIKAKTLAAFSDKLTGPAAINANDPQAVHAAMLQAVNTVAPGSSPVFANLLAGDLLVSAKLGGAAQAAYRDAGLTTLAGNGKNPQIATRFAAVARLNDNQPAFKTYLAASGRRGESAPQVRARVEDFQVVKSGSVNPQLSAELVRRADKLDTAPPSVAAANIQSQLYTAAGAQQASAPASPSMK